MGYQFALVPASGSSQLHLVLIFPWRDKVCWLFNLGVVFLFCKPRVEEEAGSCFPLVFLACSLHWQTGLHSLGHRERQVQICPEPKAFTLAVSGLGKGRCTHPWHPRPCLLRVPQDCLLPPQPSW